MHKGALLQTFCQDGHMDRAFALLPQLTQPLADRVYLSLLKACIRNAEDGLVHARCVHMHIARWNVRLNGLLGDYLVVALAKCGGLEEAISVSAQLPHLTVFSSTAIIYGYVDAQRPAEALQMHRFMRDNGIEPNAYTFVSLLRACGSIPDIEYGMKLHDEAHNRGFISNVVVGNALISMYKKCGSVSKAEDLFSDMPHRSLVTWNTMLSAYVELDQNESALHLYAQMQGHDDVKPDSYTYVTLFKACGNVADIRKSMELHTEAQSRDLFCDIFIGNTLISMYSKCGAIEEAESMFISLDQRTLVSWNAMLSAFVDHKQGGKALLLYRQMKQEGKNPDDATFVIALQACVVLMDMEMHTFKEQATKMIALEIGQALHADIHKKNYIKDIRLCNAILTFYAKLGALAEAGRIFSMLPELTLMSCNAMLAAYLEVGQGESVLRLYMVMKERGVVEDNLTFVLILRACSMVTIPTETLSDILGYIIHAEALKKGFSSDLFISSTLVSMYGKCQTLITDAENVFGAMCGHTVVSWNAMLSAYVEHDMGGKALRFYAQMNKSDVSIDESTCIAAVQACAALLKEEDGSIMENCTNVLVALEIGRALHADSRRRGIESDSALRSTLISFYGKCGSIVEAETVFYASSVNDVVSWSAMISAYVEQVDGEKGLWLYAQMENEGVSPNQLTLAFTLQACALIVEQKDSLSTSSACLHIGHCLHTEASDKGFTSHTLVGNTTIALYQKCNAFDEAMYTFNTLLSRNIVSWNLMLSQYVSQGDGEKALRLCRQMQEECVDMDEQTYLLAFQACSILVDKEEGQSAKEMCLEIGQALHSTIYKNGVLSDSFVCSTLVSLYGKCGNVEQAEDVFTRFTEHDVAMWTAMLSAYVDQGLGVRALQLYMQMQDEGASSDQRTLVIAFQAILNLAEEGENLLHEGISSDFVLMEIGHVLHADVCKRGFSTDVFVASALISMYGTCSAVPDAENVFRDLRQRDVVSCNEMMSVYMEHHQVEKALRLYVSMQQQGLIPDQLTFVMSLQACNIIVDKGLLSARETLEIGRALHSDACQIGYLLDFGIGSALVTVYGKCGALIEAESVFDSIQQPAITSWNALYSAYVQQHRGEKALELYRKMQTGSTMLDHAMVTCVLQACSATGSLDLCKDLHYIIVCAGCDWIPFIETTLVHAYGSSGSIADAQAEFAGICHPDTVSWNALLTGHASQAMRIESFDLLEEMKAAGSIPDEVTFSSLLSACRHIGLMEEGMECFESMIRDYGRAADPQHYETMVDLLGRAGNFRRIENMIGNMQMNATALSCLLGACRTHGNIDLAKWAFHSALDLQPHMAKLYVMMSNIYADAELHEPYV